MWNGSVNTIHFKFKNIKFIFNIRVRKNLEKNKFKSVNLKLCLA